MLNGRLLSLAGIAADSLNICVASEQEAKDDGANGLRAVVLDAARNMQTVVGEVVKSIGRATKKDAPPGAADGRNKRQPTREGGHKCGGKVCVARERLEGKKPSRAGAGART